MIEFIGMFASTTGGAWAVFLGAMLLADKKYSGMDGIVIGIVAGAVVASIWIAGCVWYFAAQ